MQTVMVVEYTSTLSQSTPWTSFHACSAKADNSISPFLTALLCSSNLFTNLLVVSPAYVAGQSLQGMQETTSDISIAGITSFGWHKLCLSVPWGFAVLTPTDANIPFKTSETPETYGRQLLLLVDHQQISQTFHDFSCTGKRAFLGSHS